jgi:hypothetical protein
VPLSGLQSVADAVTHACLTKGKDCYSLSLFKYLSLPVTSPNLDKSTLWQRLSDSGVMAPAPSMISGKRGKDALRPIIACKTKLLDLVPIHCPAIIPSLSEAYNINALNAFLTTSPHRLTNSSILQSYFDCYVSSITTNRKRGKATNADKALLESLNNGAVKLKAMEDTAASMGDRLFALDETAPKRRKLTVKSSEIRV